VQEERIRVQEELVWKRPSLQSDKWSSDPF